VAVRGYRVCDGLELLRGGAALLKDDNILVVADLHLGCEAALEYEGLSIPRVQTRKIEQYLIDIIDETRPSKLVVAGDLKHNFSRNLAQEWRDVVRFVTALKGRVEIEVVKGNHDNYLGMILKEHGIPMVKEMTSSGLRILHGHQGSLSNDVTIMGHIHPSMRLGDRSGSSLKTHCFLFHPGKKILVLPALSLVSPGTDVVGQAWSDGISPLLEGIGLGPFEPIAFSGSKPLRFPSVSDLRGLDRVR
jgi:hypothetical protein